MTDEESAQLCGCGHHRSVHGGHDGLARCVLRSCYCGAFSRVGSYGMVKRVSEWDTLPSGVAVTGFDHQRDALHYLTDEVEPVREI